MSQASSDDKIRVPKGDVDDFWDNFDWEDMTTAEQEAWGKLGWDQESWDEETSTPESDDSDWEDLSKAERSAAESLGYTQKLWDCLGD